MLKLITPRALLKDSGADARLWVDKDAIPSFMPPVGKGIYISKAQRSNVKVYKPRNSPFLAVVPF